MSSADPTASAPPPAPDSAPVPDRKTASYQRLPGRMATFRVANYGQRRLYLADDHLLQVETVFCVERYRRFDYADIQAFLLRQTPRGTVINVVLGVFLLGFVLLHLGTSNSIVDVGFFLVMAGICGLLLVVNLLRGPTCFCQLQTATGPQPLFSLCRLRNASKALARLQDRILTTQGTFAAGEAASLLDQTNALRSRVAGVAGGRAFGQPQSYNY